MIICIYIVFGMLIILYEVLKRKIDFITLFNIYFFIHYVFAPIHVLINPDIFTSKNQRTFYNINDIENFVICIIIIVSYIAILIGYHSFISRVTFKWEIELKYNQLKFGKLLGLVFLLLGIFFIYIYVNQYGGFLNAFINSSLIRSNAIEGGPYVFVKKLFDVITISMLIYWGILLKEKRKSFIITVLFLISSIVFLINIQLLSGRGNLIIQLVYMIFMYILIKGKKPSLKTWVMTLAIMIIFILFGDQLFNYFIKREINIDITLFDSYVSIINEITHPFLSLQLVFYYSDFIDYRYLWDWIYGLLSIIPSSLVNISIPETVTLQNTYLLTGIETSTIPPGLLAYGYYFLGIIGIPIYSLMYGVVGGILVNLYQNNNKNIFFIILLLNVGISWATFLNNGIPQRIFQAYFVWIIFHFIILIFSNILTNKKQRVFKNMKKKYAFVKE